MERASFKSLDDMEIFGHLSIPESKRPLPAVLLISGGIHGSAYDKNGEYDPLHLAIVDFLNERGYATFLVDKRGSKGYGREYESHLDLCGKEVDDVIAGCEYLKNLDAIDPNFIVIHGTSRSSTTAALALTRTDLFKAAILSSGFYDIFVEYKYEEENRPEIFPTRQSMQGKDIEDFSYIERSPINHVDTINCPILLSHGRDDLIVAPERSEEFYRALQNAGKEVELIMYDSFAHKKEYSYPSHPIGRKYWDDCLKFLAKVARGSDNEK